MRAATAACARASSARYALLVGDATSSLPSLARELSARLCRIAVASDGCERPTTTSTEEGEAARATGAGRTATAAATRTSARLRPES